MRAVEAGVALEHLPPRAGVVAPILGHGRRAKLTQQLGQPCGPARLGCQRHVPQQRQSAARAQDARDLVQRRLAGEPVKRLADDDGVDRLRRAAAGPPPRRRAPRHPAPARRAPRASPPTARRRRASRRAAAAPATAGRFRLPGRAPARWRSRPSSDSHPLDGGRGVPRPAELIGCGGVEALLGERVHGHALSLPPWRMPYRARTGSSRCTPSCERSSSCGRRRTRGRAGARCRLRRGR